MRCSDLMKKEPFSARADDTVELVADMMRDYNVGLIPICDKTGVVVGTLTDRDLAIRIISARKRPSETRAADVMSRDLVACRPDDPIRVAEQLMADAKKSRILCTDIAGRLVGIISLSDLAERGDPTHASQVLRQIAHREAHVDLR